MTSSSSGNIGRGHIVAFNILNAGRFSLGAYCTGGAKRSLETASKYAKERTAFGKPIGNFGLIRAKLAAGCEKDLLLVKQLRAILESVNPPDHLP